MADQLTNEQRIEAMKAADKDGDGVIEDHEIPKWKKSPISVFRDITGSWSSKRVLSFLFAGLVFYAVITNRDTTVIITLSSVCTALVGVSLGERK